MAVVVTPSNLVSNVRTLSITLVCQVWNTDFLRTSVQLGGMKLPWSLGTSERLWICISYIFLAVAESLDKQLPGRRKRVAHDFRGATQGQTAWQSKEKQDRDRDKMPPGPVLSLTAYLPEPSKTTPLAGDQLFETGYCLDIAYLLSLNKILISKYQRAKLMHD